MTGTITVRVDRRQREALDRLARAVGKSLSELVRDILGQALDGRPLASRTAHLAGRLTPSPKAPDAFRARIRENNWRR
jgi:hypothetical protein